MVIFLIEKNGWYYERKLRLYYFMKSWEIMIYIE